MLLKFNNKRKRQHYIILLICILTLLLNFSVNYAAPIYSSLDDTTNNKMYSGETINLPPTTSLDVVKKDVVDLNNNIGDTAYSTFAFDSRNNALVKPALISNNFDAQYTTNRSTYIGYGKIVESVGLKGDGTLWAWGSIPGAYYGGGVYNSGVAGTDAAIKLSDITDVVDFALVGQYSVLALKKDGTLWGWGRSGNSYDTGFLGTADPSYTQVSAPTQLITGVKAVTAGDNFSVILKTDGTVWTTGNNRYGQLGLGKTSTELLNATTFTQITTLSDITSISSNGWYTLAMKSDGSVWAWGNNYNGQLGDGTNITRTAPVQMLVGNDNKGICAGGNPYSNTSNTLILKSDGTVRACGSLINSCAPVQVSGLSNINTISASNSHCMFVDKNNMAYLWGNNYAANYASPAAFYPNVIYTAACAASSVFIKTDGSVWTCGSGQPSITQLKLNDGYVDVARGDDYSLYVRNDGTVWSCGWNQYGQLGDGTTTNRTSFIKINSLSNVKKVYSSGILSFAVKNDGTVWYWGRKNYFDPIITTPTQIAGLNNVDSLTVSGQQQSGAIFAIRTDKTAWWVNLNSYGTGWIPSTPSPVNIYGTTFSNVKMIADGNDGHYMFLLNDGSLFMYGRGDEGQIGNGLLGTSMGVWLMGGVKSIAAGQYYSLAVTYSGYAYFWGAASMENTGYGSPRYETPRLLATDCKDVFAGSYYRYGVLTNGGSIGMWNNDNGSMSYYNAGITKVSYNSNSFLGYMRNGSVHFDYQGSFNEGIVDYGNNYFYLGNIKYTDIKSLLTASSWRNLAKRYFVYVSDNNIEELNDPGMVSAISDYCITNDITFIGLGTNTNKSQINNLISKLQGSGVFIDNTNLDAALNSLASYVISNKSAIISGSKYILLGDTLNATNIIYSDTENDGKYAERFKVTHTDPNYFENGLGLYALSGQYVSGSSFTFDKVGKFEVIYTAQDNPQNDNRFNNYRHWSSENNKVTLFVNRQPFALFTINFSGLIGGNYIINADASTSYDLDHQSIPGKGIAELRYSYRNTPSSAWVYGLPSSMPQGTTWQFRLEVRDIDGFWSTPLIKSVSTNNVNLAPIVDCSPTYYGWTKNNITATITATDGSIDLQYVNVACTNSPLKPGSSSFTRYNATNGSAYSFAFTDTNEGEYYIHMEAFDSAGQSFYRIRGPYSIDKTAPAIGVSIRSRSSNMEDITADISLADYLSGLYSFSYQWSLSSVTPSSGYTRIPISNTAGTGTYNTFLTQSSEGSSWYLYLNATDIVTNTSANFRYGPFIISKLKLTDLRIYSIADYGWESLFKLANGNNSALQANGIKTKDMPVYLNKQNKTIKLGYKLKFKLDSYGLADPGDTISINPSFYVSDDKMNILPADIYVRSSSGNYINVSNSVFRDQFQSIILNTSHRFGYEPDPQKANYNTWTFDYYLPANCKIVLKGQQYDMVKDNSLKSKLLVVFDISGKKTTLMEYDYTKNEASWGTDNGSVYGENSPTGTELLGKGINAGEAFWYDLGSTALDDINVFREW